MGDAGLFCQRLLRGAVGRTAAALPPTTQRDDRRHLPFQRCGFPGLPVRGAGTADSRSLPDGQNRLGLRRGQQSFRRLGGLPADDAADPGPQLHPLHRHQRQPPGPFRPADRRGAAGADDQSHGGRHPPFGPQHRFVKPLTPPIRKKSNASD